MSSRYPFEPSIKKHLLIALGLAIWVFVFLYFTEPLDVNEFSTTEKLIYLPLYGLLGGVCYLCILPLQIMLYRRSARQWTWASEAIFFIVFIFIAFVVMRSFYLYIIVFNEPNPYGIGYYLRSIFVPALLVILPIVLVGRFAFGKFKEKRLDQQKIEIKGDGNYDGIRLLFADLIILEAADNYVEVQYQDNGGSKKQLIRTRLSKLEEEHPELMRTHRSFLINPDHFVSYKMQKGKLGGSFLFVLPSFVF